MDHAISNRKVSGQSCTTLDHHGVDTIDELVAEKSIVPPLFLYMFWKKNRIKGHCLLSLVCSAVITLNVG